MHRQATVRAEGGAAFDLVVWPETALSGAVDADALAATLHAVVEPEGGTPIASPLLTGAIVKRVGALHNSAALYSKEGLGGVYDKTHPLVFGEYIPLGDRFPWLYEWLPNAGRIVGGTSSAPLMLGEHRITPLICYEDLLVSETNDVVAEVEPDLLVNLTNDAWFGRTSASSIHLALAAFRAVEHRRFLVRATNSGVSAFVDPIGRTTGETPLLEPAVRTETIRWMRVRTPYERIKDAPWWVAASITLGMTIVRRRRRREE
jgi:apolipoprotein N-acyltransferase